MTRPANVAGFEQAVGLVPLPVVRIEGTVKKANGDIVPFVIESQLTASEVDDDS